MGESSTQSADGILPTRAGRTTTKFQAKLELGFKELETALLMLRPDHPNVSVPNRDIYRELYSRFEQCTREFAENCLVLDLDPLALRRSFGLAVGETELVEEDHSGVM